MKLNLFFNFVSTYILLFIASGSFAQTPIIINSATKAPIAATSSLEVLRDTSANIPFEQITKQSFKPLGKDYFLFPYSNNAHWVRFSIQNKDTSNKKLTLQWINSLIENIDLYISDTTHKHFTHSAYKLITDKKEKKLIESEPEFAFELAPNTSKVIYAQLRSQRGFYGTLQIHSAESLLQKKLNTYIEQSLINGFLFFRLFLIAVLGTFIITLPIFRIYSFHSILKTFAFWGIMNVMGPIFTNDPDIAKKINFIFYNSIPLSSGLLILYSLAFDKLPKWYSKVIYFFITATIIINILGLIDYKWYWLKAGLYVIVASSAFYLYIYIYSLVKKLPTNSYYTLPFILGLVSYMLIHLRLLGFIEIKILFRIASLLFVLENLIFIFFLGQIFRDAERKKLMAEKQLGFNLEQNARLKELDNLKTTFFANISHELRTPITLILGPLQDLVQKYPAEKLLPMMLRNTQRLLTLINQLLDISKLEAGQMSVKIRKQNINQYFRTITSSFSSLAQSQQINFETSKQVQEVWGYIDSDKLDKIVTNLLSNAFKFTPMGGKVSAHIAYTHDFSKAIITISDTGIGIKKDKLDRVFDRFYQVDSSQNRKFEGTGIGLALVKELVNVLKGNIKVESQENTGTTFSIQLPIDKTSWDGMIIEEANIIEEYAFNASQSIVTQHTIIENGNSEQENLLLIVDDNTDIRTYIKNIFANDFQIIEASNGKEGIEKAIERIPNMIISDLMMPEMDGFEFCKILKSDEKTNHIPIIMLTAKADIESKIEGLQLGADDYLTKPFHKEEILVKVKNLILIRETLRKSYGKEIVELKPDEIKVSSIDEAFITKAKAIIEKNLSDSQFDLTRFADEMAMSTVQLRRKIKALTNQTAVEFIRRYRLQRAASLLKQRAGTVSDIAYQVGFESLSYFTKVFQEEFELTPSEYMSFQ